MKGKRRFFVLPILLIIHIFFAHSVQADSGRNEDLFTIEHIHDLELAPGIGAIQCVEWSEETCYVYLDDMSIRILKDKTQLEWFCQLPKLPAGFNQTYVVINQASLEELRNTVTHIAVRGKELMGFNVFSGRYGVIDSEGIHWSPINLDVEGLNPQHEAFPNRIVKSLMTQEQLYTFVYDSYAKSRDAYTFFGFDLSTGKATEYAIENAINVCAMKADEFLFLCHDNTGYSLGVLNTSNNTFTASAQSMDGFSASELVGGLAYDVKTDSIYVSKRGRVYRSRGGDDFTAIAYIPTEVMMPDTLANILPDGRYALCTMSGVYVRATEGATQRTQLTIQTDKWVPNEKAVFSKIYPEIELNYIDSPITAEEVARLVSTQDNSVDIFEICVDYAYTALVEKGFAADLSESLHIQNEVMEMDETIRAVLMDEQGRIVAYPTQLRFWSSGVHVGYWSMVFGERPLPTTMDELLDAWLEWEVEHAQMYPDMDFVLGFDYAQYCQKIVTFFFQQKDAQGRQINVQDPQLRNALAKLAQINEIRIQSGRKTGNWDVGEGEGIASLVRFRAWDEAMNEPSDTIALTSENLLYGMYMGDYTRISLTFASGDAQKTDGTLYVYVVNPNTKNRDETLRFIESVSQRESEPYIYYAIHPNCKEPYEQPDFQQQIARFISEKAELEEIVKNIDDAQWTTRTDLEALLDFYGRYIENQENERWLISTQTLERHHELLRRLDLHADSIYLGQPGSAAEQVIGGLCIRYADGSLTLDAFLSELNNKMRMMQMEEM